MRKIFISLIIFLVMTSQALAAFKVNLPSGWIRHDSANTMVIKSLNTNASVVVAINSMGEADLTDIAERLYVQMGGTDLAQDEDGDYYFNFVNNSGAAGFVMITREEDHYLVISVTGYQDDEKTKENVTQILDSLDYEDE